jgi:hypothetical protein
MSNVAFNAQPFAEHVPDSGPDADHKNPGSVEQGAGMIELGFYVGDNRIVLTSLKAGAYTDLFEGGDPTTGKPAEGSTSSSASDEPAASGDDDRIAQLEQRIAELEQQPANAEPPKPPAE